MTLALCNHIRGCHRGSCVELERRIFPTVTVSSAVDSSIAVTPFLSASVSAPLLESLSSRMVDKGYRFPPTHLCSVDASSITAEKMDMTCHPGEFESERVAVHPTDPDISTSSTYFELKFATTLAQLHQIPTTRRLQRLRRWTFCVAHGAQVHHAQAVA